MTERILTIPGEYISGGYPVNLYKPLYKDYSLALKLYPGETRENPQGPGYTFEEFFTSLSLRNALGKEIDNRPKDAIERFNGVELQDKQFICRTFISANLIDQEEQTNAETLGDALIATDPKSLAYTITRDQLPCQSVDFTFNRVGAGLQLQVNKNYTSSKVNGCLWEEMLFASCISHIDGEPVVRALNPTTIFDNCELLDVLFASAAFFKMFSLNIESRKVAVNLGKTWRSTLSTDLAQSAKQRNAPQAKTSSLEPQPLVTASPSVSPETLAS